jgi:hypothetical protein
MDRPTLLRSSAAIRKLDLPAACSLRSRLSSSGVHLLLLFAGTAQRHFIKKSRPPFA